MFKKQTLISFFICFFALFSMDAAVEKKSAIFYNCNAETILDANSLQKILSYIMEQIDQKGTGSMCIQYTESGYTLFQALQKGGYMNVTIENKETKAYLDWFVQKSSVQKKSMSQILKEVKKALGASSHTIE